MIIEAIKRLATIAKATSVCAVATMAPLDSVESGRLPHLRSDERAMAYAPNHAIIVGKNK